MPYIEGFKHVQPGSFPEDEPRLDTAYKNFDIALKDYDAEESARFASSPGRIAVFRHFLNAPEADMEGQLKIMDEAVKDIDTQRERYYLTRLDEEDRMFAALKIVLNELKEYAKKGEEKFKGSQVRAKVMARLSTIAYDERPPTRFEEMTAAVKARLKGTKGGS